MRPQVADLRARQRVQARGAAEVLGLDQRQVDPLLPALVPQRPGLGHAVGGDQVGNCARRERRGAAARLHLPEPVQMHDLGRANRASRSVSGPLSVKPSGAGAASSRDGVGVTIVTLSAASGSGRRSFPGCSAPCRRRAPGPVRCKDAASRLSGARCERHCARRNRRGASRRSCWIRPSVYLTFPAVNDRRARRRFRAGPRAGPSASRAPRANRSGPQLRHGLGRTQAHRPRSASARAAIQASLVVISSTSNGSNRPAGGPFRLGHERRRAAGARRDQKRQAAGGGLVDDQSPGLGETRQHKRPGVRSTIATARRPGESPADESPIHSRSGRSRSFHLGCARAVAAEHQVPGRERIALLAITSERLDQPDQVLLGHEPADRQEIGSDGQARAAGGVWRARYPRLCAK